MRKLVLLGRDGWSKERVPERDREKRKAGTTGKGWSKERVPERDRQGNGESWYYYYKSWYGTAGTGREYESYG
ncbi:hypothetical protein Pmani_010828 [Petrolisthes manimaculis]|uniref:Uncharacterized protein n=1 Tax=Petrolisthes manimaculis TaxID=1843537 RepID=A0AAE1Q2B3_9EUCA|nr:hypothetical protein Pmani_010828 [Petrolisthes manimaculis]